MTNGFDHGITFQGHSWNSICSSMPLANKKVTLWEMTCLDGNPCLLLAPPPPKAFYACFVLQLLVAPCLLSGFAGRDIPKNS